MVLPWNIRNSFVSNSNISGNSVVVNAMNKYSKNFCRICSQCFCCENCRLKHEESYHHVFVDCDICIYGKTILKNPTKQLLHHIENAHFPVHCICCKTIFKSTKELQLYGKCSAKCEKSEIALVSTEDNYLSSPIIATFHNSFLTSTNSDLSMSTKKCYLTTSTPMQKSNEWELEKISAVITPVDYSESSSEIRHNSNKSNITPMTSDLSKNNEAPIKRKVTFCETPIIDNHGTQKLKRNRGDVLSVNQSFKNHSPSILKGTSYDSINNKLNGHSVSNDTIWESAVSDHKSSQQSVDISVSIKAVSCSVQGHLNVPITVSAQDLLQISEQPDMSLTNVSIQSSLKHASAPFEMKEALHLDSLKSPSISDSDELYLSSELFGKPSPINNVLNSEFSCRKIFVSNSSILITSPVRYPKCGNTIDANSESDSSVIKENVKANYDSTPKKRTDSEKSSSLQIDESNKSEKEIQGVWSSVTSAWKSVLAGLSLTSKGSKMQKTEEQRRKRIRSDDTFSNFPPEKRVKIVDVQCRKTIHDIPTLRVITYGKTPVLYYDKATQTDF